MGIFKKWLKRIGIGLLFLIILVLIAGVIYEQIGRHNAKKHETSRSGSFVDVGGHKLYYYKKGKGKPTVIFESGFPGTHYNWTTTDLFNEVSERTTVVAYDRAGMLWSERGLKPKNAENISNDLYMLLEKGGFEKPYILVGHSAAGIYFRPFAEKHGEDILGIILLDPSHPDQIYNASENIKKLLQPPFIPPKWMLDFANNTGVIRFISHDKFLFYSIQSGAIHDGITYLKDETSKKSQKTSFGNIPLLVVSAGLDPPMTNGIKDKALKKEMLLYWDSLQIDIAKSSANGRRIISKNSDHNNVMIVEKDLILKEILQILEKQDTINLKENTAK